MAASYNLYAGGATVAPGSFSSDLRSLHGPALNTFRAPSRAAAAVDLQGFDDDDEETQNQYTDKILQQLQESLNRELKIKEGSENMLDALATKKPKHAKEQRALVEAELNSSNQRIKELRQKITETQRTRSIPITPTRSRPVPDTTLRSPSSLIRSRAGSDAVEDTTTESPTFSLSEQLQALEVENMPLDYYVSRANALIDLFRRFPSLKYDLAWPIFGLRMQMLVLSDSREVVAAGYRMLRYAISDRKSIQNIRALHIDYAIIQSLLKDRKAEVEREQALKLVRAFLDVKDGVKEISQGIVRTIVALVDHWEERRRDGQVSRMDHRDDRLRPICIETLAEMLIRDPPLLIAAGGLGTLLEAMSSGGYMAPTSITSVLLLLLDTPHHRQYLQPSDTLGKLFSGFTYPEGDSIPKQNAIAIVSAMKTWPGLMTLSMNNFRDIRSLLESLLIPNPSVRNIIIDAIYSLLRIKSPGWAQSYLAGRRLTIFGRGGRSPEVKKSSTGQEEEESSSSSEQNFVVHYIALLLAVLIRAGLVQYLLELTQEKQDVTFARKVTLLLGEVLGLASRLLPPSWSTEIQLLPELFTSATKFDSLSRWNASGVIYQISSVTRTLQRTTGAESSDTSSSLSATAAAGSGLWGGEIGYVDDHHRPIASISIDDTTFRQWLVDSGVLNSSNWSKWNWEVIIKLMDGPLQIGRRVDEASKASRFLKRIMSFYRPFKYRFSDTRNTRNAQKFVRAGCALVHALLQSQEGVKFLGDNKVMRQLAECLAQCDPSSGLTAQYPMFSRDRVQDTLCGGYFPILGILSGDIQGLRILERWRMFNMMYHIVEHQDRPDLIKLILSNLDYSVPGHPRVILSMALTAGTKEIRAFACNVLRKYAVQPPDMILGDMEPLTDSKWAIELLVTQLYDVELDVAATAVGILEQACCRKSFLEYIVYCRPSLDHLGEIGAPLLLRFLSTSSGYEYLNGLDYISNEMDDWFLGRNDAYVGLIEASLARAFLTQQQDDPMQSNNHALFDYTALPDTDIQVPPHFYRELTRTKEGCKLLRDKGHFDEFVSTIRECGLQADDDEQVVKVKGCLWAVGNVGSMELGAPFLEASDVVERVVEIAERHSVMSMRGTAFFVLGLISRSTHGLEILAENGWEANTNRMGHSLGFCIPKDIRKLFSYEAWETTDVSDIVLDETQVTVRDVEVPAPPAEIFMSPLDLDAVIQESDAGVFERHVLDIVYNLGNCILFKPFLSDLVQLRQRKPEAFQSVSLFKKVLTILDHYCFRLPIRKLLLEMFPKEVMTEIVLENVDAGEKPATAAGVTSDLTGKRGTLLSSTLSSSLSMLSPTKLSQKRRQQPAQHHLHHTSHFDDDDGDDDDGDQDDDDNDDDMNRETDGNVYRGGFGSGTETEDDQLYPFPIERSDSQTSSMNSTASSDASVAAEAVEVGPLPLPPPILPAAFPQGHHHQNYESFRGRHKSHSLSSLQYEYIAEDDEELSGGSDLDSEGDDIADGDDSDDTGDEEDDLEEDSDGEEYERVGERGKDHERIENQDKVRPIPKDRIGHNDRQDRPAPMDQSAQGQSAQGQSAQGSQ